MKILHLSDLHFGTEQPEMVEVLKSDIQVMKPDIIVVTGDVTQRATVQQYKKAKVFFDELKHKAIICVPGNHDIPLYNLFQRFFYPFVKYEKYISQHRCPMYRQDNIAILGINSATPYKPMGGYVTEKQMEMATSFFQPLPAETCKIILMHHNLISTERHKIINASEKLINHFSACGVNLILSGHIHAPHCEQLKRNYVMHNMYAITAGTAISHRTSELNSYNIINIAPQSLDLIVREWQLDHFAETRQMSLPR
jgi:3',5'-cyclic AMP phosphodiesterase CpdA